MQKTLFNHYRPLLLALSLSFIAGCATVTMPANVGEDPRDPYERFNRKAYNLNSTVDRIFFSPLAKFYHFITPDIIERGIGNVVSNLGYPVTIVNLLLQGKFKDFGVSLGRFTLNSTLGLGGLVDIATVEGIPRHNEDFGQTFATWGWENSSFIMLPLLGPSTFRDGLGEFPGSYTSGIGVIAREANRYEPLIFDLLTTRVNLFDLDDDLEAAADPYLLIRDAYLQNRDFEINDGETDLPDYDLFLEDEAFFDEDSE